MSKKVCMSLKTKMNLYDAIRPCAALALLCAVRASLGKRAALGKSAEKIY